VMILKLILVSYFMLFQKIKARWLYLNFLLRRLIWKNFMKHSSLLARVTSLFDFLSILALTAVPFVQAQVHRKSQYD
jgi:hypothetical protein